MIVHKHLAYLVATVFTALFVLLLRRLILDRTRRLGTDSRQLPAIEHLPPPAELAYLLRDGDMVHTMMVMSVDLVQRLAKSQISEQAVQVRTYENQVWSSIKDAAKRWGKGKLDEIAPPVKQPKDVVRWIKRLSQLRKLFGDSLRSFIKDVTADPLHIRKYFSMAGIVRFVVDLYYSSAKQNVENELNRVLLEKGWLVPEERRKSCATALMALIPIMVALLLVEERQILHSGPVLTTVAFTMLGLLNASALMALAILPRLIPTFDEFYRLAADLPRPGRRMQMLRVALKFGRLIGNMVRLALAAILLLMEFSIYQVLIHHLEPFDTAALLLASTIASLVVVQLVLDVHRLLTHPMPSHEALLLMEKAHARAASTNPLAELRKMLTDPQYVPSFSEATAIYGIETLWLLS